MPHEALGRFGERFFDNDQSGNLSVCVVKFKYGIFGSSFSYKVFRRGPMLNERVADLLLRLAAWDQSRPEHVIDVRTEPKSIAGKEAGRT